METSRDLWTRFLGGEAMPGLRFRHNDYIVVASGAYAGKRGSVVGLVTLAPAPVYVVELEGNDGDADVPEDQLAQLGDSRGEV